MNFSQNDEQAAILDWAQSQPRAGSFVDLGCYDGEEYSNTAALAALGWPGICVDAAPDAASACEARYADRPDITVVHAAFTTDGLSGPVTIHWSPGLMYTGTSPSMRTDIDEVLPITVPRLDLDWLADSVRQQPPPLFCSIDLEGSSLDALAWLLAHTQPACVCVEANNPTERQDARELLASWQEVSMPGNNVNLLFVCPA